MIARLRGCYSRRAPDEIVVDVGGVGYRVLVPLSLALPDDGREVALEIHTVVREDAINLFGFGDRRARQAFELLLGVTRVGPRLALAIISGLPVDELITAVLAEDIVRLARVPGVGRKTAERIVLDCRDKIALLGPAESRPAAAIAPEEAGLDSPVARTALSALTNLGFPRSQAVLAVRRALEDSGAGDESELIRAALREAMGRTKK